MKPHTFLYDLKDVLSHVPSLQTIRFDPSDDGTVYFKSMAMSERYKVIVMYGRTHEPLEGFGDTCGIDGLEFAYSVLDAPGFDRASVSSVWTSGDRVAISSGLQSYTISLTSKGLVDELYRVPPLKRHLITLDATAAATEEGLLLLKYWRREYHRSFTYKADREPMLRLSASGGVLYAEHQEYPFDRSRFPISTICVGQLSTTKHAYNIQMLTQVLSRVGSAASTMINVAPQGVVLVEVKTTHCTYEFALEGTRSNR